MTTEQTSMSEDYAPSYRRQWYMAGGVILLIGTVIGLKTHFLHAPAPQAPAEAAQQANWFYVLRLPEMQVHSDPKTSKQQFTKWFRTLKDSGFKFFLLSDVVRQLSQGAVLPEKSVVLVFDPGYRRTAETYVPLLRKLNIPAVWLTDGQAMNSNDMRYISRHAAESMEASGLWDIGLYQAGSPITLKSKNHETVLLGHQTPWKESAGRFAVNQGRSTSAFERLNVNPKWTEQDLLHRLLAERPIRDATLLSMQQIQGRTWGMGLDLTTPREERFTLRAPSSRRSESLYWLGTLGITDCHLRMDVKSLIGEMRLMLRSDLTTGNGLSVMFSKGKVTITEEKNGQSTRLISAPCPDIAPYLPFNATLALMGRQLALAVNNHPLIALESLSEPTPGSGMVRMAVQDSLKGVAEARSVRIVFTPLGKEK